MSINQVSPKYAKALCAVATERKQLDIVEQEFAEVLGLLNKNAEFAEVFYNPGISARVKSEIFDAVFKQCSETMRSFLRLLAEKRREDCVAEIARLFKVYADDKRNILSGQLIVASSVSDAQIGFIADKLKKQTGKSVIIEQVEDSSIIGGFALKIDDIRYDGTVRRRLDEIRTLMSGK